MAVKALSSRVSFLVLLFSSLMGVEAMKGCTVDADGVACDLTIGPATGNMPMPTGHYSGRMPIPSGHHTGSWNEGNSTKTKGWAFPTISHTRTHSAKATASSKAEFTGALACSPTPDVNNPAGKPLSVFDQGIANVTLEQFCEEVAPGLDTTDKGPTTVHAAGLITSFSVNLVDNKDGVSENGSFTVSKSTCLSALSDIINGCQVVDIPGSINGQRERPFSLGGAITVTDGVGTVEFNASVQVEPPLDLGGKNASSTTRPLPTMAPLR